MSDYPELPPLSTKGKVLIVGRAFPPATGGSMVVMRELLRNFNSDSYCIVAPSYLGTAKDVEVESRICRVGFRNLYPRCFAAWMRLFQLPFLIRPAMRYARANHVVAVVAQFPSLDMLWLGLIVAKRLRLPFLPYLHDTISEAQVKSTFRGVSRFVQKRVFASAQKIMVMSEGMAELYRRKYGLETIPILHPYREGFGEATGDCTNHNLFWSGNIYGVNDKGFLRIVRVASKMGVTTDVATLTESVRNYVIALKAKGYLVEPVAYWNREEYLLSLQNHLAHILTLNDAADSDFGEEELATAFPTKTPEFLASGRPILLFCPKHYALAAYFKRYQCGLWLDWTSTDADIEYGIQQILAGGEDISRARHNAVRQARRFDAVKVARIFSEVVDTVV